MACTEGDVLPQDPNFLNTVFETTLSFFPLVEVPDDLRFVVIYQPVKSFEKRMYKRLPAIKAADEAGQTFYVHAHTYYDAEENTIGIECPTPMSVQTLVHEILHHVVVQVAEDNILDHLIVDRMANLIIESTRFRQALRDNH
jgi:hypothetical protein